jgi:Skp family chaperone for outer membrane proteins
LRIGYTYNNMSKLSKFTKLRSLCLFTKKIVKCTLKNIAFSIPPLQKLTLANINISFVNIQRIFQEVSSTLVHLIIFETKIEGDLKDLNVLFTALETCYIDLDDYKLSIESHTAEINQLNSMFYGKLCNAISGSEKTLRVFISSSQNLKQVQARFLKNTQVLEFFGISKVDLFLLLLNDC